MKKKLGAKGIDLRAWRIYFYFMIFLTILGMIGWETIKPSMFSLLDFVSSSFGLVGLFGLSYNRRIFFRNFWKATFFVNIAAEFVGFNQVYQLIEESGFIAEEFRLIHISIGYLAVLPIHYAEFLYAFRRDEIWKLKHGLEIDSVENDS